MDYYMDIKELIGITLGTCTLERVIGRGGMGATVYVAQQSRPVRTVAVKVLIPPTYDPDQQRIFLTRFRREADTVAKLEHQNILPIYEYDEAVIDGQQLAYLVMPFIRGGTLRERMDEMKRSGEYFDLRLVANYITQVADALSYAHSFGVVHRDVKPGNLLFHQDGRLLLSDFGIVRLHAVPALTSAGSFLGTTEYASPEQISSSEVDFRSDIYSLGIILYELLTGTLPFAGPNPFAVMTKKLNEGVPSVRDSRPDLSFAIDAVVTKALAKNPTDRYQTATMLAADFRSAIALPVTSGSALRISGDANNTDATLSEQPRGVLAPLGATAPLNGHGGVAVPPKTSGLPPSSNAAPWQYEPKSWPSQMQVQQQEPSQDQQAPQETSASPNVKTYGQSRRVIYYGTALLVLLLQFLVFILLHPLSKDIIKNSSAIAPLLGILLGTGINLLALAAIAFTGVTRNRSIRGFAYRCFAVALLTPIISGFFIGFGAQPQGIHLPLVAYLILLASNIYTLHQLGRVDAPREQMEVAPVLWKLAVLGALTGLLPLTIILMFALAAPFSSLPHTLPLLHLFGVLFVVLLGTPTLGAVMAVSHSPNISFSSLIRSSAIAGMLMFFGALLIIVAWGLIFANSTQFLYNLSESDLVGSADHWQCASRDWYVARYVGCVDL